MPFISISDLSLARESVAVAVSDGAFGSHIGIVFHSVKEGLQVLHLGWHHKLLIENLPQTPPQCWIAAVSPMPVETSKAFVSILRSLSKRLPQIKYGIDFMASKNSFDPAGRYKAPKGSDGLTCSTFVMELFRAAKLPLIKDETWPITADNTLWGQQICDLMERKKVDPDHIAHVRSNIKGLRIKPEEVAAASQHVIEGRPIDFETVTPGATQVMADLKRVCGLT